MSSDCSERAVRNRSFDRTDFEKNKFAPSASALERRVSAEESAKKATFSAGKFRVRANAFAPQIEFRLAIVADLDRRNPFRPWQRRPIHRHLEAERKTFFAGRRTDGDECEGYRRQSQNTSH